MSWPGSARRRGDRTRLGTGPAECSLADLAPGSRARVVSVVVPGSAAIARRLADLGFTVGSVVRTVRRAPLGDPAVYLVKDYEVCLRRAQASCVRVAEAHG